MYGSKWVKKFLAMVTVMTMLVSIFPAGVSATENLDDMSYADGVLSSGETSAESDESINELLKQTTSPTTDNGLTIAALDESGQSIQGDGFAGIAGDGFSGVANGGFAGITGTTGEYDENDINPAAGSGPVDDAPTVVFFSEGAVYADASSDNGLIVAIDGNYYCAPPDAPPLPQGMTLFRGWFIDDAPEAGVSPYDFNLPLTDDLALYAVFSNTYLITFCDQAGTVILTRVLNPGDRVYSPSQEALDMITAGEGERLIGWYDRDDSNNPPLLVDFGDASFTAVKDLVLMPCFDRHYFVMFISKGSPISPQLVPYGEKAVEPTPPAHAGYTFAGWLLNGALFDFNTPITEDISLEAYETANANTVYSVAIWLEKANAYKVGESPTPGAFGNYDYITTVTGTLANNLIGTSGQLSGLNIASGQVRNGGGTAVAAINNLFAAGTNAAHPYIPLKYAAPQAVIDSPLQGNGMTVINLFATRKEYVYSFPFPSGNNGWNMVVNGKNYGNGVTYPVYSFSAKYEQYVGDVWPSGDGITFNLSGSTVFDWWGSTAEMAQIVESTNLKSKRIYVDSSLLPANGALPTANGGKLQFTIQTTSGTPYNFRYFVEVLPGQNIDAATTPIIERSGKPYVEMAEYRQTMQDGQYQKDINGLVKENNNNPAFYTYNSVSGKYTFIADYSAASSSQRSNTSYIRVFFYSYAPYTLAFDMRTPASERDLLVAGTVPADVIIKYGQPFGEAPAPDPEKAGYIFTGWYKTADCIEPFDWSATMPNGGAIAYAGWDSDENVVLFLNAKNGSLYDKQGVADGGCVIKKTWYYEMNGFYEGMGIFTGWKYDIYGIPADFDFDMQITRNFTYNHTVYATWQTNGFKIGYDLAGGLVDGEDNPPVDANEYGFGTAARALGTTAVRGQEMFYAWKSGEKLYYPGNLINIDMLAGITLVAQYAPVSDLIKINYHPNAEGAGFAEGITPAATVTVWVLKNTCYDLLDGLFAIPDSNNKQIGWSSVPGINSKDFDFNQTIETTDADIDMYAVWELVEDDNDGQGDGDENDDPGDDGDGVIDDGNDNNGDNGDDGDNGDNNDADNNDNGDRDDNNGGDNDDSDNNGDAVDDTDTIDNGGGSDEADDSDITDNNDDEGNDNGDSDNVNNGDGIGYDDSARYEDGTSGNARAINLLTEQIIENMPLPLGAVDFDDGDIPLAFIADHILYLLGYPEGDVRPENSITRAEAAAIFHRLLANADKNDFVETSFSDVSSGEWYYQSVAYLHKHGIVSGYEDGTFRPDAPITRAEYATMASKFDELAPAASNVFSDVGSDHWAVAYINSAAAKGWVSGFEDGTFRPEEYITRAQVVTIVNRMLDRGIALKNIPSGTVHYTDLSDSHWAYCDIIEASHTHIYDRDGSNATGADEIWTDFTAVN